MEKKFYETEEFNKIKNEWYQRLSSDGFDDIDPSDTNQIQSQVIGGAMHVHSSLTSRVEYILSNSQIEYETDKLKNPKLNHKIILEQYAQGRSVREISKHLASTDSPMGFQGVARVINRYLEKYYPATEAQK